VESAAVKAAAEVLVEAPVLLSSVKAPVPAAGKRTPAVRALASLKPLSAFGVFPPC
jgi:hypothetical protein